MHKQILIAVVALTLAGVVYFVIGSRPPGPVQFKDYTLVKSWWPAWDTFQMGLIRRESGQSGIRTAIDQREDYSSSLEEFKAGRADAVTLTIFEAILAASQGVPLKISLLLDYTIGSDGVVAKKNMRTLPDLEGKRIGVEMGTIAHFTVLKALEKAGLEVSDVQLVSMNMDEVKQAFIRGDVDAAGAYEPYMSEMAREGDGHILFSSSEIPRSICDVLFVREEMVRQDPDVIDHWIHAWDEVLRFKEDQPAAHLKELSRLNGTPIPDLEDSIGGIFFANLAENRRAFGTPDEPGYLLESLNQMKAFMLRQGVIQKDISSEDLLDYEGIRRYFDE